MITNGTVTHERHKTVVVCGIERGGTSMVALCLDALGISMGANLGSTGEDPDLIRLRHEHSIDGSDYNKGRIRSFINHRNTDNSIWGLKIPNVFADGYIFEYLRNPV